MSMLEDLKNGESISDRCPAAIHLLWTWHQRDQGSAKLSAQSRWSIAPEVTRLLERNQHERFVVPESWRRLVGVACLMDDLGERFDEEQGRKAFTVDDFKELKEWERVNLELARQFEAQAIVAETQAETDPADPAPVPVLLQGGEAEPPAPVKGTQPNEFRVQKVPAYVAGFVVLSVMAALAWLAFQGSAAGGAQGERIAGGPGAVQTGQDPKLPDIDPVVEPDPKVDPGKAPPPPQSGGAKPDGATQGKPPTVRPGSGPSPQGSRPPVAPRGSSRPQPGALVTNQPKTSPIDRLGSQVQAALLETGIKLASLAGATQGVRSGGDGASVERITHGVVVRPSAPFIEFEAKGVSTPVYLLIANADSNGGNRLDSIPVPEESLKAGRIELPASILARMREQGSPGSSAALPFTWTLAANSPEGPSLGLRGGFVLLSSEEDKALQQKLSGLLTPEERVTLLAAYGCFAEAKRAADTIKSAELRGRVLASFEQSWKRMRDLADGPTR